MDWVDYTIKQNKIARELELKNKKEMEEIEKKVEEKYPRFYNKYLKLKWKKDYSDLALAGWFLVFCFTIAFIGLYGDYNKANNLCYSFLEHKLERWLFKDR